MGDTTLDPEMEAAVREAVKPLVTSAAATAGAALLAGGIMALVGINYKKSTMAGDDEIHPTKAETDISKADTAAAETEGKLAQDTLAGVNGEVKASETEARAMSGDATALEGGATAARTKAGAADIETKALKMT
jgi:hypothetical protein